MMVFWGEEGLECEIFVDGMQLERVSVFKYLGCVHWMKKAQMVQNAVGRWWIGGHFATWVCKVTAWGLSWDLLYVNETLVRREWRNIGLGLSIFMDNLRGLLSKLEG